MRSFWSTTAPRTIPRTGPGSWCAEHPATILLVCQSNQGPSAARNTGARLARAKYVCFLDVDDWYERGFFEAALPVLEADAALMAVACRIELVDAHRTVEPWHLATMEISLPANLILRAEAVRQLGGFPVDPAYRGRTSAKTSPFGPSWQSSAR